MGPCPRPLVFFISSRLPDGQNLQRKLQEVYIYYASSDTRLHVATTTIDKLIDYVFNTPEDPLRSVDCVAQRCELIRKNLEFIKNNK